MSKEPAGLATLCLDAGLTARQSQVIFLAADGLTYAEIAARLGISWAAVQIASSRGRRRIMEYGKKLEWEKERREIIEEELSKAR